MCKYTSGRVFKHITCDQNVNTKHHQKSVVHQHTPTSTLTGQRTEKSRYNKGTPMASTSPAYARMSQSTIGQIGQVNVDNPPEHSQLAYLPTFIDREIVSHQGSIHLPLNLYNSWSHPYHNSHDCSSHPRCQHGLRSSTPDSTFSSHAHLPSYAMEDDWDFQHMSSPGLSSHGFHQEGVSSTGSRLLSATHMTSHHATGMQEHGGHFQHPHSRSISQEQQVTAPRLCSFNDRNSVFVSQPPSCYDTLQAPQSQGALCIDSDDAGLMDRFDPVGSVWTNEPGPWPSNAFSFAHVGPLTTYEFSDYHDHLPGEMNRMIPDLSVDNGTISTGSRISTPLCGSFGNASLDKPGPLVRNESLFEGCTGNDLIPDAIGTKPSSPERLAEFEIEDSLDDSPTLALTQSIKASKRHAPLKANPSNTAIDKKRKYGCSDCKFSAKLKKDLFRHQSGVHHGQKYICPICGVAISRSDGLLRHLQNQKLHKALRARGIDPVSLRKSS